MLERRELQQVLAECLGTFCLVFAGTGAVVVNQWHPDHPIGHVGIALTFGLVVMAVIYAIGEKSGAHINPAVTLGFWVAGQFEGRKVGPYLLAQFVGAIGASFLLKILFPTIEDLGCTLPAGSWSQSFVFEFVLTAILMFVILLVANGSAVAQAMAGVAIGGTVALEAMFAGPVCGASMNPARSLGPAVASGKFEHLWIYLVATILGAILAVGLYWALSDQENDSQENDSQENDSQENDSQEKDEAP